MAVNPSMNLDRFCTIVLEYSDIAKRYMEFLFGLLFVIFFRSIEKGLEGASIMMNDEEQDTDTIEPLLGLRRGNRQVMKCLFNSA
jgi:hypothetical protein